MSSKIETSLYIINNNYELKGCNDKFKKIYPDVKLGIKCHKLISNLDTPCLNCPLNSDFPSGIYFNEKLQHFINVNTSKLNFSDEECTCLICSEVKNNLIKPNDDLKSTLIYEINENRQLKLIYSHNPLVTKTFISLDEFIKYSLKDIHPLERKKYLDFFGCELEPKVSYFNFLSNLTFFTFEYKIERLEDSLVLFMNLVEKKDDYSDISKINKLTKTFYEHSYFDLVPKFLTDNIHKNYSMIAIDIENFKMFNETYSTDEGDKFLFFIAETLKEYDKDNLTFSGYIARDDFVAIVNDELVIDFINEITFKIKSYKNNDSFMPIFGIYKITDLSMSASLMYDRALIALDQVRLTHAKHYNYFDNFMLSEIENEHFIIYEIERGLKEKEFCFYLQPQTNMYTGKIVGAEALVRWQHKTKGLIPPYHFIPLLEKNGGIIELDKYIWEEVFKYLNNLKRRKITQLPISINVSRIDLFNVDVPNYLNNLSIKYDVSPTLVEVEITESAYANNTNVIKEIVDQLHEYGFKVAMDDFGSGYSSLNMLSNFNIDILKLDMKFLDLSDDKLDRGMSILESVVNMIKNLAMPIIVEGVETEKEKNALIDMGCRYAQGYLYYRPMPISSFEELLVDNSKIDHSGINHKSIEQFYLKDFILSNKYSDLLLNNIIGAVAAIKVYDDVVELYKINKLFYQLFDLEYFSNDIRSNINTYLRDVNKVKLIKCLCEAKNNKIAGSSEIFEIELTDKCFLIIARIFYLKTEDNKDFYFVNFIKITNFNFSNMIISMPKLNDQNIMMLKENTWVYKFDEDTLYLNSNNKIYNYQNALESLSSGKIIEDGYYYLIENKLNSIYLNNDSYFSLEIPISFNNINGWYNLTGFVLYENYKPNYLIGCSKNINKKIENRNYNVNHIKSIYIISNLSNANLVVNLSSNLIYSISTSYANTEFISIKKYSDFLNLFIHKFISNDENLKKEFFIDNLIIDYKNEKNFKTLNYRRKDGSSRKICVYLTTFDDSNDIFGYFYIINIDKKANEKKLLSLPIDRFPNIKVDLNDNLLEVNDRFLELFGYKDFDEFNYDYINNNKNPIDYQTLKNIGDYKTDEFKLTSKNNEVIYVYCLTRLLKDNFNNKYYLKSYIDVTSNVLFEEKILESTNIEAINEDLQGFSNKISLEDKLMLMSITSIYSTSFYVDLSSNVASNIYSTFDKLKNYKSLDFDMIVKLYLDKVSSDFKEQFLEYTDIKYIKNKIKKHSDRVSFLYLTEYKNIEMWERINIIPSNFDVDNELLTFVMTIEDVDDNKKQIDKLSESTKYFENLFFQASKVLYKYIFRFNLGTNEVKKITLEKNKVKESLMSFDWNDFISIINKRIVDEENKLVLNDYCTIEKMNKFSPGTIKQFKISLKEDKIICYYQIIVFISKETSKMATIYVVDETKDELKLLDMKHKSEIDELTGLHNRMSFEEDILKEFTDLESCGVIFFDINNLKIINDNYGHKQGDLAIEVCGKSIFNVLLDGDFGYRYGGDEFIVVVKNKPIEYLNDLILRQQTELIKLNKKYETNFMVAHGYSYLKGKYKFSDLMKKADDFMYENKKFLKNNLEVED